MTKAAKHNCNPEKWVECYGDDMYAWAFYRTGKKTVAEDLVQETFLAALTQLKSYRGDSSEKTWLFSILKHKIIDHFRRAFVKYEKEVSSLQHDEAGELLLQKYFDRHGQWKKSERPANWHEEEDNLLDDEEFIGILRMCMKLLPEKWLSLVNLRFLEEKNTPEICKELGITSSNLWIIMHRAKLQLRDCIEENFLNE